MCTLRWGARSQGAGKGLSEKWEEEIYPSRISEGEVKGSRRGKCWCGVVWFGSNSWVRSQEVDLEVCVLYIYIEVKVLVASDMW